MTSASVLRARLQAHRLELSKSPDIADWARNRLDHAVKVMADYPTYIDRLEKLLVRAEQTEAVQAALDTAERAHHAAQEALGVAKARAMAQAAR